MAKQKFAILVSDDNGMWQEDYEKDVDNIHEWAVATIELFNKTLRPKQLPRKLVTVILTPTQTALEYNTKFSKFTNKY